MKEDVMRVIQQNANENVKLLLNNSRSEDNQLLSNLKS